MRAPRWHPGTEQRRLHGARAGDLDRSLHSHMARAVPQRGVQVDQAQGPNHHPDRRETR